MSDAHAEMKAMVARYFDGELDLVQETAVLDHLVGCAECEAELGDVMGLHAALSQRPVARAGAGEPRVPPAAAPVPAPAPAPAPEIRPIGSARAARWRRIAVGAAAVAAAAAAITIVVGRGRQRPGEPVAIALAEHRGVEVRFTAAAFAAHRPYEVVRGGGRAEAIPLAALADLERRGDRAGMVAAHALADELSRARAAAEALPAAAAADADRAAIELLAGDPGRALELADRAAAADPALASAHWNRALALRDLGLPSVAAAELDRVADAGEPGWADEARARAAALRGDIARRRAAFADVSARGTAWIAGSGPALAPDDVATSPAQVRIHFHDALRTAASAAEVEALRPLATALDQHAREGTATAALARTAALDFSVRGRFIARYRALAAGARDPATADALIADLARAGRDVDDLRLGAIVWSGRQAEHLAELGRLTAATEDPWFELMAVHERTAAARAGGKPGVEEMLLGGLRACTSDGWALRCGRLAYDLAEVLLELGRNGEADRRATDALAFYARAGIPAQEDFVLAYLADVRRSRGRQALARATYGEVVLRSGESCRNRHYAEIGLAALAFERGDLAGARAVFPKPMACSGAPDPQGISTAVDLARQSGDPADRARAEAWFAAARGPEVVDPALVALGEGRIAIDGDPAGARQKIEAALAKLTDDRQLTSQLRAWGRSALIADAGARGEWERAIALVDEGLGHRLPAACAVAADLDDDRFTIAVRGADGKAAGRLERIAREAAAHAALPAELLRALDGCAAIEVAAKPPLHGRADLLPIDRPWAYVGAARSAPPPTAPASAPPPAAPAPLIVGDATPPPEALRLPRLAPAIAPPGATSLTGADATPARVLAALGATTYAELHVHGLVDLGTADASFLALSPGSDGEWRLTAGAVRAARFRTAPVVVLGACRAAEVAPYLHKRWSLPDALLAAGARVVIAADTDLPDAPARAFFDAVRRRLEAGAPAPAAVAAERAAAVARGEPWAARVMVFE